MNKTSSKLVAALLALAMWTVGCGGAVSEPQQPEQMGDDPCVGGKCDGVLSGKFVDLFKDPRKVSSGDLTKVAADLVTDQINDLLSNVPYYSPRLSKTELYASAERVEDSLTLRSLGQLTAGLTRAFGEKNYATRINAMRQQHLERNPQHIWAEAHFSLPADPSFGVSLDSFGDSTANVRFGFAGLDRDIDATIIAPYDASKTKGLAKALVDAPARAVIAALGGMPSNLDDFRAMVPGQMIALHSNRGVGGFNINASTPLYLATVATHATLWARISAAASVIARSELDVQMIRDEGERLVVDVGITAHGDAKEKNASFSLAVDGRWGVAALDLHRLELGPLSLDLGQIARKTIQKQLDKRFTPFSAAVKVNPKVKTRHSVARYAFDLSATVAGDKRKEIERALALASNGVLYYAQYLALQAGSGVTELVSVDRVARTPSYYLGAALPALGMRFYTQRQTNIGQVSLTIGEQNQQIFWNQVEHEKGWFFTSQNYSVTGMASVRSIRGMPVDADHNLRLRLIEKQRNKASRDEILDHVDPLLATFIGNDALARIDAVTGEIEAYMSKHHVCDSRDNADSSEKFRAEAEDRQCWIDRANSMKVKGLTAQARLAFDNIMGNGSLSDGLDPAYDRGSEFARKLFELKLQTQTLPEQHDYSGPEGKMRVEARFTAKALSQILAGPDAAKRFEAALTQTVYELNRRRRDPDQKDEFEDISDDHRKAIRKVVDRFKKAVRGYVTQRNLGRINLRTQDGYAVSVGEHGLVLNIDENGNLKEGEGAQTAVATVAERKADALVDFFEALVDEAKPGVPIIGRLFAGLGTTEHQILAYTLIRMANPWDLELLVDMRFEDHPFIPVPNVSLYGRGAEADLIGAGQFDLNALIGG